MYQLPDHPDIVRIERTGYGFIPRRREIIDWCQECGRPVYEGDEFEWSQYGGLLCADCAEEEGEEDEDV